MARRPTSTSAFGVSRRESHDSSGFYRRFTPPVLSADTRVFPDKSIDKLIVGDSRQMDEVPTASVALVVTSPPYFAGKEYEEALGANGSPATYLEYLRLLRDVFAECVRALEPGGRIAVNVANLGRRPYRSLSADVTNILQDDLRLLLRGEIIWLKQRGSSGSCAWGSFQSPANPVLRDLTERVVIASKGRFDRAVPSKDRARAGLPWEASVTRDDFMEATLDMWEISPESATRVGHPAPFPVELPARLIELYTYRGDLVLDPFVGSGSTAVAALRTGRHYVGYDVDENYVRLAERRLARQGDRAKQRRSGLATPSPARVVRSGGKDWAQAISEGRTAKEVAHAALAAAGFRDVAEAKRTVGGVEVSFTALDDEGTLWMFGLFGRNTSHGSELARPGAIWEVLGKASVLRELTTSPFVLLTSGAPLRGGAAAGGLERLTGPGKAVHAVVDILSPSAARALQGLCSGRRART